MTYAAEAAGNYKDAFKKLDAYIQQYMTAMNSPGMTVAIANRNGLVRSSVYGFGDLEQKVPVIETQLFEIGSITKSFVGLLCMQLVEEGKLDLKIPITEYLPWFRLKSDYPITTHHLLTHSSGMPGNPPVFLSDPAAKHECRFVPGEAFHYCNMGYGVLGHLITTLDGTEWNEAVRRRIFQPIGMNDSEPRITSGFRHRLVKNYSIFYDDRPFPMKGRLAEAPAIVTAFAAGSIMSTARDMAKYMTMLLNKGAIANGRILSDASFDTFSKAHIQAEDFGPTASYGYGLAVDTMDGHKILRHTGGMVSFMSAMHVDMDEGLAVFASVNAQQGYRPNPVCIYGLQLLRVANAGTALPAAVDPMDARKLPNASEYAGVYEAEDGTKLEFVTSDSETGLSILYKGSSLPLQMSATGPIVLHPDFELFTFVFGRAQKEDGPVTDVAHGEKFYMNARYSGPRRFEYPAEWNAFTGYYKNDNPWIGGTRVVRRQGKLWLDGLVPLEPTNDGRFRDGSSEKSPEWISFHEIVNGKAMRLKFSGEDMWRVSID